MPARIGLVLDQANDETLTGTVLNDGTDLPQDLTGITLEMLLKASPETADDDPAVTTLSTGTGEITVISAAAGTYSVAIPDTALQAAGIRWYRVDAVTGPSRKTVVYGPLKIRDL